MGLDMYLFRTEGNLETAHAVEEILEYKEYLDDPNHSINQKTGRPYTFLQYFGHKKPEISREDMKEYSKRYITRYSYWDEAKRYGHKSIFEQVGYWRKANQIHNWLVNNVQGGEDDCGEYKVTEKQLKGLLATCYAVKKSIKLADGQIQNGTRFSNGKCEPIMQDGQYIVDTSVCESLLPTQEGFFFGGTDYDEYYMYDIDNTIKILEEVLANTDFTKETVTYHASW